MASEIIYFHFLAVLGFFPVVVPLEEPVVFLKWNHAKVHLTSPFAEVVHAVTQGAHISLSLSLSLTHTHIHTQKTLLSRFVLTTLLFIFHQVLSCRNCKSSNYLTTHRHTYFQVCVQDSSTMNLLMCQGWKQRVTVPLPLPTLESPS